MFMIYSISQEICTRFLLCCALLWLYIDFPISIRLTSLQLRQSNDCPSASKANLMNMDKYFMWIHYERLHNHNKAKHNKTVCIFLGIYCRTLIQGNSHDIISYPLFADADSEIYPHAASQYHARPKAKRGIAMLSLDKFPYPRKQTRGNEFIPCSNNICDILNGFRSFKNPSYHINLT